MKSFEGGLRILIFEIRSAEKIPGLGAFREGMGEAFGGVNGGWEIVFVTLQCEQIVPRGEQRAIAASGLEELLPGSVGIVSVECEDS